MCASAAADSTWDLWTGEDDAVHLYSLLCGVEIVSEAERKTRSAVTFHICIQQEVETQAQGPFSAFQGRLLEFSPSKQEETCDKMQLW